MASHEFKIWFIISDNGIIEATDTSPGHAGCTDEWMGPYNMRVPLPAEVAERALQKQRAQTTFMQAEHINEEGQHQE